MSFKAAMLKLILYLLFLIHFTSCVSGTSDDAAVRGLTEPLEPWPAMVAIDWSNALPNMERRTVPEDYSFIHDSTGPIFYNNDRNKLLLKIDGLDLNLPPKESSGYSPIIFNGKLAYVGRNQHSVVMYSVADKESVIIDLDTEVEHIELCGETLFAFSPVDSNFYIEIYEYDGFTSFDSIGFVHVIDYLGDNEFYCTEGANFIVADKSLYSVGENGIEELQNFGNIMPASGKSFDRLKIIPNSISSHDLLVLNYMDLIIVLDVSNYPIQTVRTITDADFFAPDSSLSGDYLIYYRYGTIGSINVRTGDARESEITDMPGGITHIFKGGDNSIIIVLQKGLGFFDELTTSFTLHELDISDDLRISSVHGNSNMIVLGVSDYEIEIPLKTLELIYLED